MKYVTPVLILAALSAVAITGFSDTQSPDYTNRSVVMISADMIRKDSMQCNGYHRNTTPFLCDFGEENIVFEDAIAQATWTRPSQASVMTGSYPSVHGVYTMQDRLNDSHELLTEKIPSHYNKGGFVGGADLQPVLGFSQGYDRYESIGEFAGFNETRPKAMRFISNNSDEEFFVFVQSYDLHEPYRAPEPYLGRYSSDYTGFLKDYRLSVGSDPDEILGRVNQNSNGTYFAPVNGTEKQLEEEDLQYIRDRYDEQLRYVDSQIEKMIDEMKQEGVYDETIIIIYSSHGESLGRNTGLQQSFTGHGKSPYRDQVRVPLMIHLPEEGSKTVEGPVELIDIYPTVLDLMGVEPEGQGDSLLDEIEDGNAEGPVFSESARFNTVAVIDNGWKFMTNDPELEVTGSTRLLYRRNTTGINNLYDEMPEKAAEMESYLKEWRLENLQVAR